MIVSFSDAGRHSRPHLTAEFTINTHTVTPLVPGSGTITPSNVQTVDYGSSLSFTIQADDGHHIDQVLINGESAEGQGMTGYVLYCHR